MSQEINNRAFRQRVLKELIEQLHEGKSVEEVKGRFAEVFGNVSAEEIAQAEAALIEGGLPVEEVQRLCDVHAAIFKGSIQEIHNDPSDIDGHPLNTLKRENRAIEALLAEIRARLGEGDVRHGGDVRLAEALERLTAIDLHYKVKENLLFPYLENAGITAPPKVMWGVDDEIRAQLKAARATLAASGAGAARAEIEALLVKIEEMIFKEENILAPMLSETLTADEWKSVADETAEVGFCLIEPPARWSGLGPERKPQELAALPGSVRLPTGVLTTEELSRMLDTLPIDITFVGADDTVRYFSQAAERVFPRTKAIIGRKVENCHPPASVHVVEKIVEDLRSGRKEHEDFWIQMGDKFILIRYFAVRSLEGEYLGVLEVTQNIRPIQAITGEKRLASD